MAARLKVFTWSDGLRRYTVATASRAKALEAWGFHRDLFKTGDAQEITSGEDHDRALASPGVGVERGLKVDTGKVALKPAAPKPKAPSKRDRERVRTLEDKRRALEAEHDAAVSDLDRRRDALNVRFETDRGALDKALDAARRKLSS